MIPLIDCGNDDANRYYQGTLVFHLGVPVKFIAVSGTTVVVEDGDGQHQNVRYSELYTTIVPPFYGWDGEYKGHVAGRRTSRSIPYSRRAYDDIISMLRTGDVPPLVIGSGKRLNKDFKVTRERHLDILFYREELVGFLEEDTYYVSCPFIKERLEKLNVRVSMAEANT